MAKLLLVEDDNNLREIYEARLQAEGYTIVSARDGEEALVVAKAEKPDLVISDVMMPKISGFEMLDIMRNTDELKGVKVIMLTALGQSDDQKRADKLGADRYLVKSQVTLEDIVSTAHALLGDQEGGDKAAEAQAAPASAAPAPDPASQAQPAAATPAPAPAPAPEPAKDESQSAATATPSADDGKDAAEPAAKEEADVEAKIEDFVAGASSEPTAPAQTAQPQQAATPPVPAADANAASDDKLMSDAVDQLVASTDQKEKEASTPPKTNIPVSVAPDDKAQSDAGQKDDSKDDEPGSRKVIKPLDSKPKKDINELLAEEEAKDIQAKPGATVSASPSGGTSDTSKEDLPAGAPTPPPSEAGDGKPAGSDADPNNIAL